MTEKILNELMVYVDEMTEYNRHGIELIGDDIIQLKQATKVIENIWRGMIDNMDFKDNQ